MIATPTEARVLFEPAPPTGYFNTYISRIHQTLDPVYLPVYLPPVYQGVEKWRGLVSAHWPLDQVNTALCIMEKESGGNSNAKNPTSEARGLFQVMASTWAGYFGISYEDLYDPGINVSIAKKVYDIQGWGAWSSAWKCL